MANKQSNPKDTENPNSEFEGPKYDDHQPIDTELSTSIKQAADSFLAQETQIAKLTRELDQLRNSKTQLSAPKAVKDFTRQAFPGVTTPDSALALINHLIATDQANPRGWFNVTTQNIPKNKLQMIQAIVEIGLESERS